MLWSDVTRFLLIYLAVVVTASLLGIIFGNPLNDADYTDALIFAGVWTIVRAIRDTNTTKGE